jgi:hypothetical protein
MMARIVEMAADHPLATTIILGGLTFALASTIARAHAVHTGRLVAAEPTPEAEAIAKEPARLARLREGYTSHTKDALAYLTANVWEDASGSVVAFTDECICTRSAGQETWEPYAVCASARRQESPGGNAATVWVLCLETETWSALLSLTVESSPSPDAPAPHARIECAAIASGNVLTASEGLKPLAVEGPDEATLEAHGTCADEVGRALAAWCADWRPTARTATWDETILEDHEERTWQVRYVLDDARETRVAVIIRMDTHELEVREGRWQ